MIVIIGAVGAGKSSLLHCILNEMTIIKGEVKMQGSIAYVEQ